MREYEISYSVNYHNKKAVITSLDKNGAIEKLKAKLNGEGVTPSTIRILKVECIGLTW